MLPAFSFISDQGAQGSGTFTGLVICVTGLSKDARKQVMTTVKQLGGEYSSDLHPHCTHLVVQSLGGRKLEHILKYGLKNDLLVVTMGWFVDSVKRKFRMSEFLYIVKNVEESGLHVGRRAQLVRHIDIERHCLSTMLHGVKSFNVPFLSHIDILANGFDNSEVSTFTGKCLYMDTEIPNVLQKEVADAAIREGAIILDNWFVGCTASHVVCEVDSISKYIGHVNNLVTPIWVLRTVKEKTIQKLVHLSADLARQAGTVLEKIHHCVPDVHPQHSSKWNMRWTSYLEHRKKIADLAKAGARARRACWMQSCQMPLRPFTPGTLLDSICWSVSEPPSTACVYTNFPLLNDAKEHQDTHVTGIDMEETFNNATRLLKESEKEELIIKNHFLTLLFPIDRFGEMGPSSKMFFSEGGFTCMQVLNHIYSFYQQASNSAFIAICPTGLQYFNIGRSSINMRTVHFLNNAGTIASNATAYCSSLLKCYQCKKDSATQRELHPCTNRGSFF